MSCVDGGKISRFESLVSMIHQQEQLLLDNASPEVQNWRGSYCRHKLVEPYLDLMLPLITSTGSLHRRRPQPRFFPVFARPFPFKTCTYVGVDECRDCILMMSLAGCFESQRITGLMWKVEASVWKLQEFLISSSLLAEEELHVGRESRCRRRGL